MEDHLVSSFHLGRTAFGMPMIPDFDFQFFVRTRSFGTPSLGGPAHASSRHLSVNEVYEPNAASWFWSQPLVRSSQLLALTPPSGAGLLNSPFYFSGLHPEEQVLP
ncbi:hypothetical protein Hypma_006459 [Hypsizygus marmoreus]|uniref:Uncharacterized protein n=1 Tax=Hypsizygus marmoreus TaxID=39966 RepID=A0A369JU52_HYPMA|nr:hypothetical protein Hypma_006459 [Hypsizygus marmoreus]